MQDLVRLGRWTVSAGLRWDHYHLLVDQNAVSPRLGVSWYWPRMNAVFHASYDRIFQTPAFENILLSSSNDIAALSPEVLRLPVKPSLGNFFEVGVTKGILGNLRLDLTSYSRSFSNYADDDLLLNTGVSFPIAFRKAEIYGAEAKLEIPHWGRASGYLSYSYMLGVGYTPVTGGLFLGDDVAGALANTGKFPVSQDQRNTVSARFRYQATSRIWLGFGGEYGSGLPTEFTGTPQDVINEYGLPIYNRINFARGRVHPLAVAGRIGGSGHLETGQALRAPASRPAESHQPPQRDRFRRPVLRYRHRSPAELRASPDHPVLTRNGLRGSDRVDPACSLRGTGASPRDSLPAESREIIALLARYS